MTIRCTHEDNLLHPVTKLNLVVDGIPLSVEVGLSPYIILKLSKWLRGSRTEAKEKNAMLALTLAGDRHMEEERWRQRKLQPCGQLSYYWRQRRTIRKTSGALEFGGGRVRDRMTRSQKRAAKGEKMISSLFFDASREALRICSVPLT